MFCLWQKKRNTTEVLETLAFGVFIGATATYFSDERRRENLRETIMDWMERSGEKIDRVKDSARRITNTVKQEIEKETGEKKTR